MNVPTSSDSRRYPHGPKTKAGSGRDIREPRTRRRRPSPQHGRPVFSMVLAAAIVLGLPTVAYTAVNGSALGGSSSITDPSHRIALYTQPALSAHGGGTGGHGQAGGAGGAPGTDPSYAPNPGDPGAGPSRPGGGGGSGGRGGGSPLPPGNGACQVNAKLVPSCGVLWGVAPGAYSSTPRDQALYQWESTSGRTTDIFHTYHRGDEQFPTASEISVANQPGKHRLLLINWKVA